MRGLEICFVGTPWLAVGPNRGGIPKTILELSNALSEKHDVHVISARPVVGTDRIYGTGVRFHYAPVSEVRTYPIPDAMEPGLQGLRMLGRMAFAVVAIAASYAAIRGKRRFDVTIMANKFVALPILLLASKRGTVFVYSERNIWPWLHGLPVKGWSRLRYLANVWLGRLVSRMSDAIHANSDSIRTALIARGLSGQRIVTIPNGVDLNELPTSRRELSEPLQIGFVGRLVEDKGARVLRATILRMNAMNRRVQFSVFGDGPLRNLFAETTSNCTWHGERSRREVLAHLRSCHVVLFLSPVENVPSNALMEALALGKAVIATKVGDTSRFLVHGENGLLCNPDPDSVARAIISLLEDRELYDRLTSGARSLAQQFSWDEIAARHLAFYTSLLPAGAA